MTAAIDIIKKAMKIAQVLGSNETPKTDETQDHLFTLNGMLALWANDRTFAYSINRNNFALTNGVGQYTIGPGGDFNIQRPVIIDYAFVRLNLVDYPLQKINNQDYDSIPFKQNRGFPTFFYYDAAFPLGTMYIYGAPQQNMTLFIDTWIQLTQFTDITTDLSFPPGYEMAIIYNLAKMISGQYGTDITQTDSEIAVSSLAMVRSRNMPDLVMKLEAAWITGNYPAYAYGPWSY